MKKGICMKILSLVGSPRKGSNTDILIDQILKGAKENGHSSDKIYLYDKKISPCIDCRKCKKGELVCPIKDDMQEIYQKMVDADLIIFGTPIYWYGPTGPMKLLIDRMRPFIANRKLNGKKGLIVTPSEEGPKACGPLIEMFRMSFEYLKMKYVGEFLVIAYERGEINENQDELERAYKFGRDLL